MESVLDALVIGAGQAGLSTAYHLRRLGLEPARDFVIVDANDSPGGAWQHRWPTLRIADVHGISTLPGAEPLQAAPDTPARTAVADYFADYELRHHLSVLRPVRVRSVHDAGGLLRVRADTGAWTTRTLVNATGTWERPFVPRYPGADTFTGRQLHPYDYSGPAELAGQRVLVVGGGHSAVQLLAEISTVAKTIWVTRTPPRWREDILTADDGRAAVRLVTERVRDGLPPQSVVSVTGLFLRGSEREAQRRGVYRRRPMFERITPTGVAWADGTAADVDVIVWATGFRPDVSHLAPLHLRTPAGGIRLAVGAGLGTAVVADPRVQLVGYGPSASTIGANRAGRIAARNVVRELADAAA